MVNVTIGSVTVLQCAAPDVKPRREKFDLKENESLSTENSIFEEHVRGVVSFKKQGITGKKLIKSMEKMIGDHFEQRLQSAFQQYITCYGSGFTFEEGFTEHQGPSARQLKDKNSDDKIAFDAAHSTTIPCLYATDAQGNRFVYMKFSDVYFTANSTMEIMKNVNKADIAIDGNKTANKTRRSHLELINTVARNALDPREALKLFHKKVTIHVKQALKINKNEDVLLVLTIYQKCLAQIEEKLKDEGSYFDSLMHVKGGNTLSDKARQTIYTERYKIIQEYNAIQSGIRQKIHEVVAEILEIDKFHYFNFVFKAKLMKFCHADLKMLLQSLYCQTEESLNDILDKARCCPAKKRVNANVEKIKKLVNSINPLYWNLEKCKSQYQRNLLRKLREDVLGYSQTKLAQVFKEQFEDKPMSQPTLSRTETGVKEIGKRDWEQFAEVLEIDADNFFPLLSI